MAYIDGFVLAVPADKKDEYVTHARAMVPMFKGYGATRMVEGWGDDVPRGKLTDFYGAVQAQEGEVVLFSWIEWPSKDVRDAGMKRMMEDPAMQDMAAPFDAKRMIFGGFVPVVDE